MQKLFFILIGTIFLNTAEAQKYRNPSGYAFSILVQPGTIPVDENGRPIKRRIMKERFIYILTAGKTKPVINTILYGKTDVKWDVSKAEKEFSAIIENTQKTMKIKPSQGCSMWRINIQEILNQAISENNLTINIKGKIENKSFTLLLNKETAVQGFDSY